MTEPNGRGNHAPTETPTLTGVAVVSGGSRGLGQVLAERLLEKGYRVATFSRTPTDFVEQATAEHPEAFHWQALDLLEPAALRGFARAVNERLGAPDLLVNNAGSLQHQELLLTISPKQVQELLDVNLSAPILLTQVVARLMMRRRAGVIVNISSINAVRGFRGVSVYAAAKAGMEAFTRSLARELGPVGIRVNCLVPGYFDSDMTAAVTEQNRERIQRRTPLGRLGSAREVADAVLYLASPEASFITGQSLVVDGGITC